MVRMTAPFGNDGAADAEPGKAALAAPIPNRLMASLRVKRGEREFADIGMASRLRYRIICCNRKGADY
jgi:hypothetical protein